VLTQSVVFQSGSQWLEFQFGDWVRFHDGVQSVVLTQSVVFQSGLLVTFQSGSHWLEFQFGDWVTFQDGVELVELSQSIEEFQLGNWVKFHEGHQLLWVVLKLPFQLGLLDELLSIGHELLDVANCSKLSDCTATIQIRRTRNKTRSREIGNQISKKHI